MDLQYKEVPMTVDPSKIPPLAQSTVRDVEIVCCLTCCPVTWFTRAKTPQPQSPAGFNPRLAPVAKAIAEEVHRQRADSTASRKGSIVAIAESKVVLQEKITNAATVALEQ